MQHRCVIPLWGAGSLAPKPYTITPCPSETPNRTKTGIIASDLNALVGGGVPCPQTLYNNPMSL